MQKYEDVYFSTIDYQNKLPDGLKNEKETKKY